MATLKVVPRLVQLRASTGAAPRRTLSAAPYQRVSACNRGRATLSTVCLADKKKGKSKSKGGSTSSSGGAGFGAKREVKKPQDKKMKYDYPQLDGTLKPSETAEYFMFVRKLSDEKEPGRWMPLGDIAISADASVEAACRERRDILLDYAEIKYVAMKVLIKRLGERLEYGVRVQRAPAMPDADPFAIVPINLEGDMIYTVPARLQLLNDLQWDMKEKSNQMNSDAVVESQKKMAAEGTPTIVTDMRPAAPSPSPPS
eukprot:CAMPEP_0198209596 /NCGR_PEP_ID=MMETSP1445-20131203/17293_1 /TAXON_ID=36898 /ORGANISM="Pyramimonas sp., Strain CCMP2087" /LENGTH=256 /DNA_ID=CAMNT_0043883435 /DNA_START=68 /DNA_END=835 /DNA_ORIENTATION=+